jgi:hypothetical protein
MNTKKYGNKNEFWTEFQNDLDRLVEIRLKNKQTENSGKRREKTAKKNTLEKKEDEDSSSCSTSTSHSQNNCDKVNFSREWMKFDLRHRTQNLYETTSRQKVKKSSSASASSSSSSASFSASSSSSAAAYPFVNEGVSISKKTTLDSNEQLFPSLPLKTSVEEAQKAASEITVKSAEKIEAPKAEEMPFFFAEYELFSPTNEKNDSVAKPQKNNAVVDHTSRFRGTVIFYAFFIACCAFTLHLLYKASFEDSIERCVVEHYTSQLQNFALGIVSILSKSVNQTYNEFKLNTI